MVDINIKEDLDTLSKEELVKKYSSNPDVLVSLLADNLQLQKKYMTNKSATEDYETKYNDLNKRLEQEALGKLEQEKKYKELADIHKQQAIEWQDKHNKLIADINTKEIDNMILTTASKNKLSPKLTPTLVRAMAGNVDRDNVEDAIKNIMKDYPEFVIKDPVKTPDPMRNQVGVLNTNPVIRAGGHTPVSIEEINKLNDKVVAMGGTPLDFSKK